MMRSHAFRIAVWAVIASEAMLFAGLFALYTAYRSEYPAEFHLAAHRDIAWIGGTNTMILLTSSFAMAMAIERTRRAHMRAAGALLAVVIVLGVAFLGFKLVEWTSHLREGIAPGSAGPLASYGASLFFTLYYLMTGLHAAHVVAGLALVAWVFARVHRRTIDHENHVALELVGLYWHFVDVVWVFLWPLFYLVP